MNEQELKLKLQKNEGTPTSEQKAYLSLLAELVGVAHFNAKAINTRSEAARLIALFQSTVRNSMRRQCRCKKHQAFSLAFKTTYRNNQHLRRFNDANTAPEFWDKVHKLYSDYRKNEELAVLGQAIK